MEGVYLASTEFLYESINGKRGGRRKYGVNDWIRTLVQRGNYVT